MEDIDISYKRGSFAPSVSLSSTLTRHIWRYERLKRAVPGVSVQNELFEGEPGSVFGAASLPCPPQIEGLTLGRQEAWLVMSKGTPCQQNHRSSSG